MTPLAFLVWFGLSGVLSYLWSGFVGSRWDRGYYSGPAVAIGGCFFVTGGLRLLFAWAFGEFSS